MRLAAEYSFKSGKYDKKITMGSEMYSVTDLYPSSKEKNSLTFCI